MDREPSATATTASSSGCATARRSGPLRRARLRTLVNLNEYVVHHEDVRRANGREPRTDRPDLQDAVWAPAAAPACASSCCGAACGGLRVELERPGGDRHAAGPRRRAEGACSPAAGRAACSTSRAAGPRPTSTVTGDADGGRSGSKAAHFAI